MKAISVSRVSTEEQKETGYVLKRKPSIVLLARSELKRIENAINKRLEMQKTPEGVLQIEVLGNKKTIMSRKR